MKKIIKKFLESRLLNNFFAIELTATEKQTANESLNDKYVNGLYESFKYGLLAFPAILFLDSSVLVSVLIPITMVSGTAWFAVSLVNIKKKFENFGNELTKDLYRSFCTSLILLATIALISLNYQLLEPIISYGNKSLIVLTVSGILGTFVVLKMIFDVFAGATKYDMNDSMLSGQNESADRYFKRSLSLLNTCASNLRLNSENIGKSAYYFSLAFYEVFNYVKISNGGSEQIDILLSEIESLKINPPKSISTMKKQSIYFIEHFLKSITNKADKAVQKAIRNIDLELNSIKNNHDEDLSLLNLRLSTILEESEDLLVSQGESLFIKRIEIEKKYLVKKLPAIKGIKPVSIKQGYVETSDGSEERVRSFDDLYFHTIKRDMNSNSREETEKRITKEEFDKLWKLTEKKRVSKKRYIIPFKQGLKIELDVFEAENTGLILAEVEFDTQEEAEKFIKPQWFDEDVTENSKYKNRNLAK